MRLEINPNAKLQWKEVGNYATQVLVVDDFLANAEEVREFALTSLSFRVPRPFDSYPGYKAFATLDGGLDITKWVGERALERIYPNGDRPPGVGTSHFRSVVSICQFAVLACDTKKIQPGFDDQHTDDTDWMATVIHLSRMVEGRGTALWRHRPTGIETWQTPDLVQLLHMEELLKVRMIEQLRGAMKKIPLKSQSEIYPKFSMKPGRRPFSTDEDAEWELLEFLPAKFNRLVAYPTWQIHSVVDMTDYEELTTENMRLTLNQFVEWPSKDQVRASAYPADFYRPVSGLK